MWRLSGRNGRSNDERGRSNGRRVRSISNFENAIADKKIILW